MISESLKKKVGQLFQCGFPSPVIDDQARTLLEKYYVGNYIYFGRNCLSARQVAELSRDLSNMVYDKLGIAPLINIDQEGGNVSRLTEGAALMPGAAALSAATTELTEEYLAEVRQLGENSGRILRSCGVCASDSPDLDVNCEPVNPIIGCRSYGDSVERVAALGIAMMQGMKAGRLVGAIKHFPGHGNVKSDSHLGIPINDTPVETLQNTEFKTFELALQAGAEALMSAHVRYTQLDPENPGTISPAIHTTLLREQFGSEAVSMTDCMEMDAMRKFYPHGESAVRALEAGIDMITISHTLEAASEAAEAIYAALESGRLSEERIDQSYQRVINLKKRLGLLERQCIDPDKAMEEVQDPAKQALCNKLSRRAITLLQGTPGQELPVALNRDLVVVAPPQRASTGAEDLKPLSLATMAAERWGCEAVEMPLNGTEEDMAPVIRRIDELMEAGRKQFLFAVYNVRFRKPHLAVLEHLREKKAELMIVLMGAPYDLPYVQKENRAESDSEEPVVVTYDYTTLSMNQLLTALEENTYEGKCPFSRLR